MCESTTMRIGRLDSSPQLLHEVDAQQTTNTMTTVEQLGKSNISNGISKINLSHALHGISHQYIPEEGYISHYLLRHKRTQNINVQGEPDEWFCAISQHKKSLVPQMTIKQDVLHAYNVHVDVDFGLRRVK